MISIFLPVWTPEGEEISIYDLARQNRIKLQRERRQPPESGFQQYATLVHRLWIFWEISYKDYRRLQEVIDPNRKGESRL